MPEGAACMDGSWDHNRDGKLLIYDIICILTLKIIEFEKSEKAKNELAIQ